ncbi:MAG: hypothetical protein HYT64_02810 [Candidatus Yanofskybacteria bacterium]|nr:hypothetical protein [Candidatus Yanofskybacteria bacterium]
MKPVNIKKLNYRDEAASRHRRAFVLKIVLMALGAIVVVAGIIYLLFFSRLFDVREVSFNGLDTVGSDEFKEKINEHLDQKIFGYLPRGNNIFFINVGNFEKEFALAYPVFKSVNIQRNFFHGLALNFVERKPAGIWCFASTGSTGSPQVDSAQVSHCQYFDENKVLWGQPVKSSGFIFLMVEDNRQTESSQIDNEFFKPIMEVAKSMPGKIKNIIIPADSFNEFRVYTTDYYIIFTTEFDIHPERGREGPQRASASYGIQNQLDVLKIFLDDKSKDSPPAGGFHPQYIDLRIDGRVYYK